MTTLMPKPATAPTSTTPTASRRRSMAALFASTAFMSIAMVGAGTVGTLIAAERAGPHWSGLPNAAGVLGTAFGALAGGMLMARRGRRFGLLTGYGLGVAGALTAFAGALTGALPVLLAGMVLIGVANSGTQVARYAAADLYPAERKAFGLSVIVWAGTVGAIAGPAVIAPAATAAGRFGLPDLSGPILVAALIIAAAVAAAAVLPRVSPLPRTASRSMRRGLATALRHPSVLTPLAAMVAAQAVMVAVMTMTPLQLHHHGHGLDVVGWVLSAHLAGMFVLAPLSGRIADRWGGRTTILAGIVTLALSAAIVVAAPTAHDSGIPLALFLLGYGWNLVFVGGSSILSGELPADERVRLQGIVDALVWGSGSLASLGAGLVFGLGGYSVVALFATALLLLPISLLAKGRSGVRAGHAGAHER